MNKIIEMLIRHEGMRLKPYTDTVGKLTIGVGRNLTDNGITEEEARSMLKSDIHDATKDIRNNFKWYDTLSTNRKRVIIAMVFNMGINRFKRFKKTIAHIESEDYEDAALEMLRSKWALQVGKRADELSKIMRNG